MKITTTLLAAVLTVSSASATIVFSDDFNYTTTNAFLAEGGWTSHTGTLGTNIGSDSGSGFMWGNSQGVDYNYGTTIVAGDTITVDANIRRTLSGYFYSRELLLWDGSNAATETQIAFSDLEGNTATSGDLTSLSYTVTAADLAGGNNQLILRYRHSANWGETNSVSLDVTAVPEPSSTALLGLGGLALILRRRK